MSLPAPLDGLDPEDLDRIEDLLTELRLSPGEFLFREGDPPSGLYVLDAGQVRIHLEREELDTEPTLAILDAPAIVGELSLFDGLPRSASACASSDVRARHLSEEALAVLTDRSPRLAAALLRLLGGVASRRLRGLNERLATSMLQQGDPEIDAIVDRARAAAKAFRDWPEGRVMALLSDLAAAVAGAAQDLAEATVAATGVGNVADKTAKNRFASLGVLASISGGVGIGPLGPRSAGVLEIAEPVGVVFGLVPMTNPVATAVFKTLISLKGRNSLILSFHRQTLDLGQEVLALIRSVLAAHAAPSQLVQTVGRRSSRRTSQLLMSHPGVAFVLATGGASAVRAAYSSGTPAIGVGPGNAPALVCADADLAHAAACIVSSKGFDNGLICGSEHNVVVECAVREMLVAELERCGAAVLDPSETGRFERIALRGDRGGFRIRITGQGAEDLAAQAGIHRSAPIRLLVVPASPPVEGNPWAREKMAPMSSLFTVDGFEDGVALSCRLLAQEGAGHTAMIHTRDPGRAEEFARRVPASRILVNSPGAQGVIGVTTNLVPSLTLGCGTFGRTSTTDNVTYTHLRNVKRMAEFVPGNRRGSGDADP